MLAAEERAKPVNHPMPPGLPTPVCPWDLRQLIGGYLGAGG